MRIRKPAAAAMLAVGGPLAVAAPAVADGNKHDEADVQVAAQGGAAVEADATAQGHGNGRAAASGGGHAQSGAAVDADATAQGHGNGQAAGGGAHAQIGVAVDGHSNGQGGGHVKARGQGHAQGGAAVDGHSNGQGGGHVKARGQGHANNDRVTISGDGHRVRARIHTSGETRAAVRENAKQAARERVRLRFALHESAGRSQTWFSAKLSAHGARSRLRVHVRASGTTAVAFMRVFEAAFQTGGPAAVEALLALCFGSQANEQPLPPELAKLLASFEGKTSVKIKSHGNGGGEGHGKPGGEGHGKPGGEGHGKPGGESQEAPKATAPPAATAPAVTSPESIAPEAGAPSQPTLVETNTPADNDVLGAESEGEEDTAGGGGTAAAGPSASTNALADNNNSAAQLAFTGLDVPLIAFGGLGALLAGLLLRRRARAYR